MATSRWRRSKIQLGLELALYQALTQLAGTGRSVRSVPPRRGDEVDRPDLLRQVVDALVAPGAATVGLATGLVGAGGFGKTTLARMVAHHPRVQERFVDGIVWVTVGADTAAPDLAATITSTARLFDPAVPQLTEPLAAGAKLGQVLAKRRVLLVVDDVWSTTQVEPVRPSPQGRWPPPQEPGSAVASRRSSPRLRPPDGTRAASASTPGFAPRGYPRARRGGDEPSRTGPGTTPSASAEPPTGASHSAHAPSRRTQPYAASSTTSGASPARAITAAGTPGRWRSAPSPDARRSRSSAPAPTGADADPSRRSACPRMLRSQTSQALGCQVRREHELDRSRRSSKSAPVLVGVKEGRLTPTAGRRSSSTRRGIWGPGKGSRAKAGGALA